jgi:hypothetical protein
MTKYVTIEFSVPLPYSRPPSCLMQGLTPSGDEGLGPLYITFA